MFSSQWFGRRGIWVLCVIGVVGLIAGGCTSFFNRDFVSPNSDNSKNTSLSSNDEMGACVTSVMEPERSQILEQALADPQLQAVRAQLEQRGLTINSAQAMAKQVGNGQQLFIPFGDQAYLVWSRNQNQTTAYGMIRQDNKTLNINASGVESRFRILKGNQLSGLLGQLQQKSRFQAFKQLLTQQGKLLAQNRFQMLLDEIQHTAMLALTTEDATEGRFTHLLKFRLKAGKDDELDNNEDPAVNESACNSGAPQNEKDHLISFAPSENHQLVPLYEPGEPGGGGYGDPGELCTSSWGYQYFCYSTSPQFNPQLASLQPETFVFLGKTSDTAITFWNYGGQTLTGNASIGAPFSIVSGGSYSLNPGQANTVVVRYNPTTAGSSIGTLRLTKGSTYQDVYITAWTLTVSSSTMNFGEAFVATSYDQTLTIQSYAPVIDLGVGMPRSRDTTVSLSTVAPFSFSGNATATVTIGSNGTNNATVRFNATTSGNASNTIQLNASYSTVTSNTTVNVTGLAHKINFGSASLAFAGLQGGAAIQQTVTVTNAGGTTAVLTPSSSSTYFSIASPTGSFTLPPNQSQQVVVSFNSTASASGNLLLKPGTSASSLALPLSATAHKISFEYSSLNLQETVNGSYTQQSVTVTNTGTTTVSLTPSAAAPFSITSPTSAFTLTPGQSQIVAVRFSSATAGTFNGSVVMTSGGNSLSIPATAKSYALSLEFTPALVDFGETFVGNEPITRTVTVKNTTPILVTLTPNPSGAISVVSPNGTFTLGPTQSQQVTIKYNPTESEVLSTTFAFYANNGGAASNASVNVTGVVHKVSIDTLELSFLGTVVGSSVARKLTVKNDGISPLSFTANTYAPFVIVSPTSPFSLAPTASQEIDVSFNPISSGIYHGSINLVSNLSGIVIPVIGKAYTFNELLEIAFGSYNEVQDRADRIGAVYIEDSGLNMILGDIDGMDMNKYNAFKSLANDYKDHPPSDPQSEQAAELLYSIYPADIKNWFLTLAQAIRDNTFETEYSRLSLLGLDRYEQAMMMMLHLASSDDAKNLIYNTATAISQIPPELAQAQSLYEIIRQVIITYMTRGNTPNWSDSDAKNFADTIVNSLSSAVNHWISWGFLSTTRQFIFTGLSEVDSFLIGMSTLIGNIINRQNSTWDNVDIFDSCGGNCEVLKQLRGLFRWSTAVTWDSQRAALGLGTIFVAIHASEKNGRSDPSWQIVAFVDESGNPIKSEGMTPAELQSYYERIQAVFTVEFMPKGILDPNKSYVAITGGHHCQGSDCATPQTTDGVKSWLHKAVDIAKNRNDGDQKVVVFGFTKAGAEVTAGFLADLFSEFRSEKDVAVVVTWQESDGTVHFACVSAACNNLSYEQRKALACKHETGSNDCNGKRVVEHKSDGTTDVAGVGYQWTPPTEFSIGPYTEEDFGCTPASIGYGC